MNYEYVPLPHVIRESSRGYDAIGLLDEALSHREVMCQGPITMALADSVCLQLRQLAHDDPASEVTLVVNSDGGDVDAGFAIIDVMAAVPCPVRTLCVGRAASMAALVLMCGEAGRRQIMPRSRVMIHNPWVPGGVGGTASDVQQVVDDLNRTSDEAHRLVAERCGHTVDEVREKMREDCWFSAEEAREWGVVDEVVERL